MKKWIFMLLLAGSIQGIYAQKTEKKEKFNPATIIIMNTPKTPYRNHFIAGE